MEKIKIMVAEDHEMFRDMLSSQLIENNFNVIGKAEDGEVLLNLVEQNQPDILLLDLKMPKLDGKAVLKIFAKKYPRIKTIILSNEYSDYHVADVILRGAAAYIRKSSPLKELLNAITKVYQEGFYFNDVISRDILELLRSNKKAYYIINDAKFSEREIEVLIELYKNQTVDQIAENLNIKVTTVNFHKSNLFKKTDSENIIALVKFAIKQGIVNGI